MNSTFLLHHNLSFLIRMSLSGGAKPAHVLGDPRERASIHCLRSASPHKGGSKFSFSQLFSKRTSLGKTASTAALLCLPEQHGAARAHPGFWELFLCPGGCRAPAQPQPQGGTVTSRCARPCRALNKHLSSHLPRDLVWERMNNIHPPGLDL